PGRLTVLAFCVAGATAAGGAWAFAAAPDPSAAVPWSISLPFAGVLIACSTVWTTRQLTPHAVGVGVLSGFATAFSGAHPAAAVVQGVVMAVTVLFVVLAFRFTVWVLDVVLEMDRTRGVQLQLAVAEERLRFARDLHDVMGRNLSAIAVKSQLAGELVRRSRPEAADEVADISRIAEESLKEVREVVRGYRRTDLAGELAAPARCCAPPGSPRTVQGEDAAVGLPESVQVALAWVVREAVTNVLRHSGARRGGRHAHRGRRHRGAGGGGRRERDGGADPGGRRIVGLGAGRAAGAGGRAGR
ncbi:hypothetical protein A7K94_0220820, partial [Modestobacter sp. VKM Ac-2676]